MANSQMKGKTPWWHYVEDALITVLVLTLVLLAGAQILLRNFFDTGFSWADPLLRALVLWTAMLGALAAAREDKHIGLDLITHFAKRRVAKILRIITLTFAAIISALMAWYGIDLVLLDYGSGNKAFAAVPSWVVELIIPIGFALLALRLLRHVFLPPHSHMPALVPELP